MTKKVEKVESPLNPKELKILQVCTILAIIVTLYFLFTLKVIPAMIIGLVFLGLQKGYVKIKTKQKENAKK